MDNKYNIKTEKINHRFKNYESMKKELYIEDIERLKSKTGIITAISLYTVIIFTMVFIGTEIPIIILILTAVFCSAIILLYFSIITYIIIPDKFKETYKKGYYIHGYILDESLASAEIIGEIFLKPEKANDFLATLLSGVFLEERECFECKKKMNFTHYYRNNISKNSIQELEKIWKSSHIQLFCCRCYKKKTLFKKWKKGK